jgi:hypothetical protein
LPGGKKSPEESLRKLAPQILADMTKGFLFTVGEELRKGASLDEVLERYRGVIRVIRDNREALLGEKRLSG